MNSDDLKGADYIWGENLGCLTGKTPRRRTPHIRATIMPIPVTNLQRYRDVTLVVDVMYVNSIWFVNIISCNINPILSNR